MTNEIGPKNDITPKVRKIRLFSRIFPTSSQDERMLVEIAKYLFTAAGTTGGSFNISKAFSDRYDAQRGDIVITVVDSETGNGDKFVTITRDRKNN